MLHLAVFLVASMACVYLAEIFLKYMFGRCNPLAWYKHMCALHEDKYGFSWFDWYQMSFPSGHCSVAGFTLMWLVYIRPQLLVVATFVLLGLTAAMVVSGHHFLSDCLAGTALGLSQGYLSLICWRKYAVRLINAV